MSVWVCTRIASIPQRFPFRQQLAGLFYIGAARDMRRRADVHETRLRRGTHPIKVLLEAHRRFPGHLRFTCLEVCTAEARREREQYWLEQLAYGPGECLNRHAVLSGRPKSGPLPSHMRHSL